MQLTDTDKILSGLKGLRVFLPKTKQNILTYNLRDSLLIMTQKAAIVLKLYLIKVCQWRGIKI